MIPISARYGWNLASRCAVTAWYDGPTLFEALDSLPAPARLSGRPLRFPIQDVYEVNGRKVFVGRIEWGWIEQGQPVACLPSCRTAHIASVERFLENRTSAQAGESIGVTLVERLGLTRGEVLCDIESPLVLDQRFEANVFWLADAPWTKSEPLILRCTTQETPCRIQRVLRRINSSTLEVIEENAARLEATEVGHVELSLERPIAIEPDGNGPLGRFVLVTKNMIVSAGGTVTRM